MSHDQADYVDGIVGKLAVAGLRVEVDHSDDRMQKKIRTHTLQKVPFLLLAGRQGRRGRGGVVPIP